MTHIAPCTKCPLAEGCERRDELRQKVKGLGARSIRFGCPKLGAEIRPGRRIVIRVPRLIYSGYGESYTSQIVWDEVPATIIVALPDYSFTCMIDRGALKPDECEESEDSLDRLERKRRRKLQKHIRVRRFLDEEDAVICSQGSIITASGCDNAGAGCECNIAEDKGFQRWSGVGEAAWSP